MAWHDGNMESVISISEVVGTRESPLGIVEVCATVESSYDRVPSQLVARLDACVQTTQGTKLRPQWLPAAETLREHLARADASEVARDMFHRWVRRVRETIPDAGSSEPELTAGPGLQA
jgi:hypothetical protein